LNKYANQVDSLFTKQLLVYNSPDPDCPNSSAGVVIIINKELINPDATKATGLIPGYTIHVSITWQNSLHLSLINIYAPTTPSKHPAFWTPLKDACTSHATPHPDLLLGDFNITDNPIDRTPTHPDANTTIQALQDFSNHLNLIDQW
jgi:exonuclease III